MNLFAVPEDLMLRILAYLDDKREKTADLLCLDIRARSQSIKQTEGPEIISKAPPQPHLSGEEGE